MLYLDIPTHSDIVALATDRNDFSVSIYLPTTPLSQDAKADSILLKNLAKEAAGKMTAAGAHKKQVDAFEEQLADLVEDYDFWRFQANGLAIMATPDNVRTFRVPNALSPIVMVSDRFFLKPLLRAVSFRNSGYVLAFAEGSVRLVEISADLPATAVKVEGLPKDAKSAVGRATMINDSMGSLQGKEGQKVLFRQYARHVDAALRPLLAGCDLPLILAANEPLTSIYRSVNTYPHLAQATLDGGNDRTTDAELATLARPVLDGLNQADIAAFGALFATRELNGRATADIAQAARAATFGAVDTLLVDIDALVPGTVDEADGKVVFADGSEAGNYGVVDEIARRVILNGGRVLGVRQADIPHGKPLAAVLRYAV